MGNSFLKSYKGELDRLEQQRRYDQEQAWKDEQRGRQRQDWQREDDFNRVIQEEYAPIEPTVEHGAGGEGPTQAFQVRGKQFQTRDAADQYAASENAPTRRLMRAADRGMAIDPTRATKLRNDAMTSRAAELQLSKAEQEQADEIYNRQILGMLDVAPNWWDGAAKIGEVMLKGNGQAGAELSPDGKTVRLFAVDAEGKRTERGEFPANAQGREMYLQSALKTNTAGKMAFITSVADAEREYDKRQQTRAEGLEDYEAKLGIADKFDQRKAARTPRDDPSAAMAKKIKAIEDNLGRPLSEAERMGVMGLRGERSPDPASDWRTIEMQMLKDQVPAAEIKAAKIDFMEMRGIAPPEVVAVVRTGINPKTRKPFGPEEIAALEARYPNTNFGVTPQRRLPTEAAAASVPPAPSRFGIASPQRQYGTGIVPPRTAADMRPSTPVPAKSDEPFMLDLGRYMQK